MSKSWEDVVNNIHPDKNIRHEITWWIEQELTIEEWQELDDRMSEVFEAMGIEDYSGVAGPIPEITVDLDEMKSRAEEGRRIFEENNKGGIA